jgi:hypothetical protein
MGILRKWFRWVVVWGILTLLTRWRKLQDQMERNANTLDLTTEDLNKMRLSRRRLNEQTQRLTTLINSIKEQQ